MKSGVLRSSDEGTLRNVVCLLCVASFVHCISLRFITFFSRPLHVCKENSKLFVCYMSYVHCLSCPELL